jgi:aliphatic nitrilase
MGDSQPQIRVAAAQVAEAYMDKEATIEKDCRYIREAGERDIDLVVFPEFHVAASPYWYWYDDDFDEFQSYYRAMFENAIEVPEESIDRIQSAAREAGVAVVLGVNERERGTSGTIYNSQIFVDADGSLLGRRRKLVPTRQERVFRTGGTGEAMEVFELQVGTLGGLMCGEHTNPLAVYTMLALGEQIHAASWPAMPQQPRGPEYRERRIGIRTRYTAFAGKTRTVCATGVVTDALADSVGGLPDTYDDSGTSAVFGPDGAYLAGPLHEGEGLVTADIDMSARVEGKRITIFSVIITDSTFLIRELIIAHTSQFLWPERLTSVTNHRRSISNQL